MIPKLRYLATYLFLGMAVYLAVCLLIHEKKVEADAVRSFYGNF